MNDRKGSRVWWTKTRRVEYGEKKERRVECIGQINIAGDGGRGVEISG